MMSFVMKIIDTNRKLLFRKTSIKFAIFFGTFALQDMDAEVRYVKVQ